MTHVYPPPTATEPLVLPYSAIALFKRCRKAYELSYERLIEVASSEAAQQGTDFHRYASSAALYRLTGALSDDDRAFIQNPENPMRAVWAAYKQHRGLPTEIVSAEDPLYVKLLPKVYLRTTFDLVYRDADGWIVGRDYKTFEKAPALDVDLDFQGRIYIAALMRRFRTDKVRFEYEYVRRVPPGTSNSKGTWSVDDCYINVPVVISNREAEDLWKETQDVARDILAARRKGTFYRGGTRKEFGSPCLGCWQSDLCKAEIMHGHLDDEDVRLLSTGVRERACLPEKVA